MMVCLLIIYGCKNQVHLQVSWVLFVILSCHLRKKQKTVQEILNGLYGELRR